jgi:hypothetical protein
MRIIILLIVVVVIGCAAPKVNRSRPNIRMTLYVFNDESLRPGQTLENEFWETPRSLDTIEIRGERLISLYKKQLSFLKDTALYDPGELDEFPHNYALIFRKDNIADTIYSNRLLYLFKWKNRNTYYTDTTGFFRKHFGSFLIN